MAAGGLPTHQARGRVPALGGGRQDRQGDQPDPRAQPRDGPLPHPECRRKARRRQSQPDHLQGRPARLSGARSLAFTEA